MNVNSKGSKEVQIFCDGGARGNPGPGACAFVVIEDEKILYKEAKYLGIVTNNVAEYNGVINALRWLQGNNSFSRIKFYLDSQLVVNQLNGIYKIKNDNLKILRKTVGDLEKGIRCDLNYQYVPREKNKLPDKLLNEEIDENL